MSFQFPLATVLRVRGILEEQEERLLQKILFELTQTREALTSTETRIAELDASRRADIFKPFIGRTLHASYGEVEELKQNRKNLEEQIVKLEQLRDRQLAAYEKARQNREMLTDMHEEQRSAYESGLARLEQKAVDDNFNARRGRHSPLGLT
jgi:flagellar export protein FliJ